MSLQAAYILYRFPTLSETFIARELEAVHNQGVELTIISLLAPRRGLSNPVAAQLKEHVIYAPGPLQLVYWIAILHYLVHQPVIFVKTLVELLRQPYPNMFFQLLAWRIYIFTKGVAAAYLLKDRNLDLLHTHFAAWPGAATVIAAKLLKLPFCVTAGHGYDLYTPSTLLEFVVAHAAQVVTVAEQRRQDILTRCPALAPENVPVIPCSIYVEDFPFKTRQVTDRIRLLSVGRLIEAKGHEYLVQACAELKHRKLPFHCTIVGAGTMQAQQNLHGLITKLALTTDIHLAGACTFHEILDYYQKSDIYVMPCVVAEDNTRDATPVVFVEAAATGLPLISTPIGGVPEIVVDGMTGRLVPERNARAVADAIVELAENDEQRKFWGSNGRKLVEQKFNSVGNAAKLVILFEEVADRFNSSRN